MANALARICAHLVWSIAVLFAASAVVHAAPVDSERAQIEEGIRGAPDAPRFDEEAARSLITAHGFYLVSRLRLDERGAWRGTAVQYGRTSKVEIDVRGQFTNSELQN